jgi:hypothetical protein
MGRREIQVINLNEIKLLFTINIYIIFRLTDHINFSDEIEKPKDISDEYWDIIKQMVQVEPENRRCLEEVNKL